MPGWSNFRSDARDAWRKPQTPAVLLALALGSATLSSCGGSAPAAPEPVAVPLRPGLQLLTLTGYVFSADPAFPPCSPAGQPRDGTSVSTVVNLTAEGREWVGRSASPTGNVEVHLHGTGSSFLGYTVEGTMTGFAIDLGLDGTMKDIRVTLASASGSGAAVLDGRTASPVSNLVVGRVTGSVKYSDSQGQSTCSAIQWSMQPFL
jgi:hypothetical protein